MDSSIDRVDRDTLLCILGPPGPWKVGEEIDVDFLPAPGRMRAVVAEFFPGGYKLLPIREPEPDVVVSPAPPA